MNCRRVSAQSGVEGASFSGGILVSGIIRRMQVNSGGLDRGVPQILLNVRKSVPLSAWCEAAV